MKLRTAALPLLLTGLLLSAAGAAGLKPGRPESVGFSRHRLERITTAMRGYVDRGELAGAVTLVARDGRIVYEGAVGMQDREKGVPMRSATIFRLASMSKPVTSVAAMILYEEGQFLLNDPVARFLPAFRGARVLKPGSDPARPETEPAARPITVRDLLTHRSGLVYDVFDSGPVGDAYRRAQVTSGLPAVPETLAEVIDRLAAQPLAAQPGREWLYGMSTDTLGRLVEVASGKPLDVFMRERIFEPLRMADTGFVVPEAKWERFAAQYTLAEGGGIRPMRDPERFGLIEMSPWAAYREPRKYFPGGAGLVSTAGDYARFCQMLLNGGELDGKRILSRKSVELMTVSHTSDLARGLAQGSAFGLGFGIVRDLGATEIAGSPGAFSWGGIYGTRFWVDPQERLVAVILAQQYPSRVSYGQAFQALTYQALVD